MIENPQEIRSCAVPLIENIKKRNMVGYRIKVSGEWYEISVSPCEAPNTYSDIADAEI